MYILAQAEIITHKALKERLRPYGYSPENITPVLWTHQDRDIHFTLVVNDFGLKYRNKKYMDHLIAALRAKYEVTQYWMGDIYCGIKLKWYYAARLLDIYMPGYVKDALNKFQHPTPTIPHHSPNQWTPHNYDSAAPQMAQQPGDSAALDTAEANIVQQLVVTFLYYARIVEPTILVTLNIKAAE